jgi:hypothetical protein
MKRGTSKKLPSDPDKSKINFSKHAKKKPLLNYSGFALSTLSGETNYYP